MKNLKVIRKGGHLGHSSVFWKLRHNATNDVSPISGHINFTQGEVVNDMLVDVIADEIPEFNESIQIDLYQVRCIIFFLAFLFVLNVRAAGSFFFFC